MRHAVWMGVGLVLGLTLSAAAQRQYHWYYRAERIASASEEIQLGYVAGVFDTLEELVGANDKHSGVYAPRRLADAYTCMDSAARTTGELAKWARGTWRANPGTVGAGAMIVAGYTGNR